MEFLALWGVFLTFKTGIPSGSDLTSFQVITENGAMVHFDGPNNITYYQSVASCLRYYHLISINDCL